MGSGAQQVQPLIARLGGLEEQVTYCLAGYGLCNAATARQQLLQHTAETPCCRPPHAMAR